MTNQEAIIVLVALHESCEIDLTDTEQDAIQKGIDALMREITLGITE